MKESVVSDEEIKKAFLGTNFGERSHRELLEVSVLKKAVDYHCGHTITEIMKELRLINKQGIVLKKGKLLIREGFNEYMLCRGG